MLLCPVRTCLPLFGRDGENLDWLIKLTFHNPPITNEPNVLLSVVRSAFVHFEVLQFLQQEILFFWQFGICLTAVISFVIKILQSENSVFIKDYYPI